MRLSADGWYSGEHFWAARDFVEREFSFDAPGSALGGIQHMSSCACAGCLSKIFEHVAVDQSITPPVQQVVEPPDIPDNTSTPYVLAIGGSDTGNIATVGDDDWFAVTLTAGQSYVFTMTPSGASPLEDTYLEIYNSGGALIGLDDDGGPGTNSLLRWTATESGTYYINARAWEPDSPIPNYTGTGTYTVSAAIGPPQNPLDTINLGYTAPLNIQVWFSPSQQSHTFGGTTVTAFRDWSSYEMAQAMAALQVYSNYTNLNFSIAPTLGAAEFVLTIADLEPGTLGFFGTSGGVGYGAFAYDGSGWTNEIGAGLSQGGLGWVTLIHEFGHGLGLAHPHDNGGVSEVMQGVTDLFNSYGTFGLNQGVYTTMTYNDGWESQFGNGVSTYGSQGTPMALDVALLQQRYGANGTFNQGANTYVLPTVNQPGTFFACIWDTGGIDTIVHNGSTGATIDLRAATLLNAIGGGGWVSWVSGIRGGFTIANGVVIENAFGGSGNDTLIGNAAGNELHGNGGADSLTGADGNDTIFADSLDTLVSGGNGIDWVYFTDSGAVNFNAGTNGVEVVFAGGGNDTINASTQTLVFTAFGGGGGDVLTGGTNNDTLFGQDGDDTLTGGGGGDVLWGEAGADQLTGGEGDDTFFVDAQDTLISGGNGYDYVYFTGAGNFVIDAGAAGLEWLFSSGGSDTINAATQSTGVIIYGGSGGDTITGGAGADVIFGQDGNDVLTGGALNDTLWGEAGADQLTGGDGDDTLIIDGQDTLIIGGNGYDYIYFTGAGNFIIDAGAAGLEWLFSSGGNDTINAATQTTGIVVYAAAGGDTVTGGAGVDVIFGQDGDDILAGGGQSDTLWGEAGADQLSGGEGDDTLIADVSDTVISGGNGYDFVYVTGAGNFSINAGASGVEWIRGLDGNDTLNGASHVTAFTAYGGNGADTITGGSVGDVLFGEGGDDVITGGAGGDVLIGGGGSDDFVFAAGWGSDLVTDFQNGLDQFDMTALAGNGVTSIANLTITTQGADALISWNGNSILVQNAAGQIEASDFIFGP